MRTAHVVRIALALTTLCGLPLDAQQPADAAARTAWLQANTTPIRTMPADTNYADLAALRAAIGDRRVVMLGETSHGDAATFLMKARLVRFLHQEMGFDVIAFESGLYNAPAAWTAIRRGQQADSALRAGLHGVWGLAEEFEPVIDYVGAQARTSRPLEVTGFDMRFSGSGSHRFRRDLTAALGRFHIDTTAVQGWSLFAVMADSLARNRYYTNKPPAADQHAFLATLTALGRAVEQSSVKNADQAYWRQLLRSVEQYAARYAFPYSEATATEATNARDAQMAENFAWLLQNQFAGRKVIVWAATAHVARGATVQDLPRGPQTQVSFGDHLARVMPDDIYTIGFMATEGRVSLGSFGLSPADLPRPRPGSLDQLLAATTHPQAFLDLKHLPRDSWLRTRLFSDAAYTYGGAAAVWPDVMDGIIHLRRMWITSYSKR